MSPRVLGATIQTRCVAPIPYIVSSWGKSDVGLRFYRFICFSHPHMTPRLSTGETARATLGSNQSGAESLAG